MDRAAVIEALLRERAGYVVYGRTDRVAQVDAELAALGHDVAPAVPAWVEPDVETASAPPAAERRRRG